MDLLRPYEDRIYAALRIVAGLMFVQHGLQKLFGLFGGTPGQMSDLLRWSAGLIELVGGLLVAGGLFTGPAAFICSGTMAVAYFMVHQPQGLLPILNRGELAVLYCWVFFLIAARGGGTWSLDASRGRSA